MLKPAEVATARQGAIQTALAAGAGIGAAITVMLAFRRQRHQELTTLITSRQADRAAELADRRGFATAARRAGATLERIGRHGGWRDGSTALLGYLEEGDKWTGNPVAGL